MQSTWLELVGSFIMPDTGLLFPIVLAVLSSHRALGCPAFTSCQTRMAAALGTHGADTVRLCRALRDYLVCTRDASDSCGMAERGYVVEAFNVVNIRYSMMCSAIHTTSASATVDSTTTYTTALSSATSTVSATTALTSVEGEKTTLETDLLPQNRPATLPPESSDLPEVTSDYTSPKDQVSTSVSTATTVQIPEATKRDGSSCIYIPGVTKQSSLQLCTVGQIMTQFNSGCPQLDDCGRMVFNSLGSSDDFLICGSLLSYTPCAQKAKLVCKDIDVNDSAIQNSVMNLFTGRNCTAVLKETTTSVEMSPATVRYSVSAPTRRIPGIEKISTQPEASSSATDTTSYILGTDRFKVTNIQNVDVTSSLSKDTNTPTVSYESTSLLEVTNAQNTDASTPSDAKQVLKGTSTPSVSFARTSRVKDTQNTEVSTVPLVSSADRQAQVLSSTAFHPEDTTEVKTDVTHVAFSSMGYLSSEPAVVRRDRSSTLRPLSHADDIPIPASGSTFDMTTTENRTPSKTNLWTSLVTKTRIPRVTSPSIHPGQSTEGFHQSRKTSPQSTDPTGFGTRSSTEMKKTSPPIPGEFPSTTPFEEEESNRDTSNPQGGVVTSSGTNTPTRRIPGIEKISTQPEASSSATDTTSYILGTDRFKVTNIQNVDVTSSLSKDTNTPTVSFESTSLLEVTNAQNTDASTPSDAKQVLKGTSTPSVSFARTSRVKDTQNTEPSTVPLVSSADRQAQVSSSTAFHPEDTTEVKTDVTHVAFSFMGYLSSEPAVVRRDRSSTLRPLSHADDIPIPATGSTFDMTTTENRTPSKTNLWTSLVTKTRTPRVTSPSFLPGQPTEGFHQSMKTSPQSTDPTGFGTRSSTEMKKTSPPIPGEFPNTTPFEEEESNRDTSYPQGGGVTSSGTNRSLAVSTVSTVLVSWICWTLYISIT